MCVCDLCRSSNSQNAKVLVGEANPDGLSDVTLSVQVVGSAFIEVVDSIESPLLGPGVAVPDGTYDLNCRAVDAAGYVCVCVRVCACVSMCSVTAPKISESA